MQHWKQFFANHKDYVKVGRVSHPPINPASPIPEHCDAKKQAKIDEANREAAKRAAAAASEQAAAAASEQNKKSEDEL